MNRAVGGNHQRRLDGELFEPPAPGLLAGPHRHLHQGRARDQHRPPIAWSASHGCDLTDSRAVNTNPGLRPVHRRAQQRGGRRLRPVVLPLERVGRQVHPLAPGEDRGPVHRHAVDERPGQRGQEPARAAVVAAQRPGTVTAPSAASSRIPVTAAVSTGCAETSMKTRCPEAASTSTARPNSTGARRFSYQYPAPASGPVSHSPLIAEIIGTCAGPGAIPSSAARISSRMASTCALCEA